MSNDRSAANGAEGINDSSRGLLRHVVVTLFAEKCLIHILRTVGHGVKRRHQRNHVEEQSPMPFEHNQEFSPKITRHVLPAQPSG